MRTFFMKGKNVYMSQIESKCVQLIKENNRLALCKAPDMSVFLSQQFNVKGTYKWKKQDLLDEAYKLLDEDTLKCFTDNLKNFGLLRSDVAELLGCTDYRVKELIKEGRIKKVGESGRMNITYFLYDVNDTISLFHSGDYPKKQTRHYEIDQNDENIAEALYIINKSAKKSRDTRHTAYHMRKHGVCHAAKTRSIQLYALKNHVIQKMISEGKASFLGFKKQIVNNNAVYLKTYAIADRQFHIPCDDEVNDSCLLPGAIERMISAEKKNTVLNYIQALTLLKKYVGYEELT